MTDPKRSLLPAAAVLLLLLLLSACQSGPVTIEENLSPAEYFQRAQEASSRRDYELARRYYETFQRVYPDNLERNLWAEYEIAFLYHKMGDDERAMALLEALMERYRTEATSDWPQAPRLLAARVQESIRAGRPAAAPGRAVPPATPVAPSPSPAP